jgi:hypothetical protein
LAPNSLYESYSPVGNLYFKEGYLHLQGRLIGVILYPFQIEAEGMATVRKYYFETGEAFESVSLYQVAA